MNKKAVIRVILGGLAFLLVFASCNQAANTRKVKGDVNLRAKKDSTSYVFKGDSIPLSLDIEQMMDYPSKTQGAFSLNDIKDKKYLHMIDGKMVKDKHKDKFFQELDLEKIKSIQVISGSEAVEQYGKKATNGVVIIESKKEE